MKFESSDFCERCRFRPCTCTNVPMFCQRCHFLPCICTTVPEIPNVPAPEWTPYESPARQPYPAVEPEPPLTHDEIRRLRRLLRRSR